MTRKPAPAAHSGALDPAGLFASLAGRRGLILGVSGGPDSTALMILMSGWAERPPVLVVTVDHGLRPEAADEVRLVAENAERLTLPSRITRVNEGRSGNLQDWARRARYACLAAAAREAGFDTIVTAHHQDDQAETFLLRLARGSGVYGLTAMREEEWLDDLMLARPLLRVARSLLYEVAHESGLKTVADPSNADLRFDRVRMRALMPTLAEHGLDAKRLAETAARLGRAAKAIDHYASALLKTHFRVSDFGVVSGPATAFVSAPEEVALRSLARILKAVGGADYTPRLDAVESLVEAVASVGVDGAFKRTLSGVVVEVAKNGFAAGREWGREGLADVPAPAGSMVVWDGRFRVEVPPLRGELAIGALGRSGRRLKCGFAGRAAIAAAPGLYRDGALVAVPAGIEGTEEGGPLGVIPVKCLVGQRLGIAGGSAKEAR